MIPALHEVGGSLGSLRIRFDSMVISTYLNSFQEDGFDSDLETKLLFYAYYIIYVIMYGNIDRNRHVSRRVKSWLNSVKSLFCHPALACDHLFCFKYYYYYYYLQ